jgi:dTDP-4-dehydrorhamnose reductase
MKKIMITGASGQLGLALYRLLKDKPEYKLLRTDAAPSEDGAIQALDITKEDEVKAYVKQMTPEIIINCAAFTAVDLCETEEDKAFRINALGPGYLAEAAEMSGAKLIHISTDYVFDGKASSPYTEMPFQIRPVLTAGQSRLGMNWYRRIAQIFYSPYCLDIRRGKELC